MKTTGTVCYTYTRARRTRKENMMKERKLKLSDVALIATTRGMLGAGIGLLLSGKLNKDQRRAAGWALVAVGAVTTIPILMNLLDRVDDSRKLRAA